MSFTTEIAEEIRNYFTEKEILELKASFKHYDKNGNGRIDAEELDLVMQDMGMRLTSDQLQVTWQQAQLGCRIFSISDKSTLVPYHQLSCYVQQYDKNCSLSNRLHEGHVNWAGQKKCRGGAGRWEVLILSTILKSETRSGCEKIS